MIMITIEMEVILTVVVILLSPPSNSFPSMSSSKGLSIRGGLRDKFLVAAATGLDLEVACLKATSQDPIAPKPKHVASPQFPFLFSLFPFPFSLFSLVL